MEFKINVVTESKKENIKDLCLETLSYFLAKDGEYFYVDVVNNDDFVVRMIAERIELKKKIEKLEKFILNSEVFKKLSGEEKYLLTNQMYAMKLYLDYLTKRCDIYDRPCAPDDCTYSNEKVS